MKAKLRRSVMEEKGGGRKPGENSRNNILWWFSRISEMERSQLGGLRQHISLPQRWLCSDGSGERCCEAMCISQMFPLVFITQWGPLMSVDFYVYNPPFLTFISTGMSSKKG